MSVKAFSVISQPLGGFMSRRWHEKQAGVKFRKQIRRRVQKQGGDTTSIEIRDESGLMVDYCMSTNEYHGLLNNPVDVDATSSTIRQWQTDDNAKKIGNLW